MARAAQEPFDPSFIRQKIALLLDRYLLSFRAEESCIEYFITDAGTREEISCSLVFSLNTFSREIHVCKFWPQLYLEKDSRYLSAACFYLCIHHFAKHFRLTAEYRIFLQTREEIFHDFYATLRDFDFRITRFGQGENVDVASALQLQILDTSYVDLPPLR